MSHRVWVLGAMILGLAGCAHQQTRLQAADEVDREREKEADVKTIGSLSSVGNAEPIAVSGVGLVVGLEGTGGNPPAGSWRTFLEDQLRKHGVDNIREVLASPDTSLVLVSGLIPAGAHEGDPFDIEVTLPQQTRTTSLRGGYLKDCVLFNYDMARHAAPDFQGPDRVLLGHPIGHAEGPLLIGFGDGDAPAKLRRGKVWGGGRSKIDRAFYLIINAEEQRAPLVQLIADRINQTFQGQYQGVGTPVAVARTKAYLTLAIPAQYKNNLSRYLRVVRLIPLQSAAPANSPYHKRLERELLDPAHTVTAALRLEALGTDSIGLLKQGLENAHPLVRFASAEALAYLGSPTGGEELAALTERQPALRAYSLTALASLDEAVSHVKLRDLLASSTPDTRYGAFRALRALDEREPAIQGEQLGGAFWLHRVAPDAGPLVHLSTSRRAEVVLFGQAPALVPPFTFLAGEFTIAAGKDDTQCTISRLSAHRGTARRQCGLKLEEVLRTLADLGGMYPEVVDLMRQAGSYQCVSCPVAFDALPQATSVFDLARNGGKSGELVKTDQEILDARADFGATPTLYDRGTDRRSLVVPTMTEESASQPDQDREAPAAKGKPRRAS